VVPHSPAVRSIEFFEWGMYKASIEVSNRARIGAASYEVVGDARSDMRSPNYLFFSGSSRMPSASSRLRASSSAQVCILHGREHDHRPATSASCPGVRTYLVSGL
jgi:hypothetical protein